VLFLIAGIFTPCLARYGQEPGKTVISGFLWTGAVVGLVLLISWRNVPRFITPLLSFVMGIIAIISMIVFIAAVPFPGIISFVGGASLFMAGGVFYAIKKPNLRPGKFGFHDLYHAMTLAGTLLLHVLVWLASTYNTPG
jgi:hemolysin III